MHDKLIPVMKDGEYLEVHPTALAQHKQLGWALCEQRKPEPEAEAHSEAKPKAKNAKAAA